MTCCYSDANGTSCRCHLRADATQEVERLRAGIAAMMDALEWIAENDDLGYMNKFPGPFATRASEALRQIAERDAQ